VPQVNKGLRHDQLIKDKSIMDNSNGAIIQKAYEEGLAVPSFNIPYLPVMEPVINAVVDLDSFALITVARLEWIKFEAKGPAEVAELFYRCQNPAHVRLHLDHVPVIDEDNLRVDTLPIFEEAIRVGYDSLMIDGSRLGLEENIQAVRPAVELGHAHGKPVEAELGAVFGHESGPMPSYEELFASGRGFTDVEEARRFVQETGCDWLSVAIGNVHGAIAAGAKDKKKIEARLNLERLEEINQACGIPLVLHGGSGIQADNVRAAMKHGIAKINIGTEIRQAYEVSLKESGQVTQAQQAVYERARWVIQDFLGVAGSRERLVGR
jgi:fructose-bisphosphate aldolase, class II